MSDTIKVIHDTIFVQGENPMDVINKVGEFYDKGWTHLVIVGSVILATGALVVPYWLNWLEKRRYKLDKETFENFLKAELAKTEAARMALESYIKSELGKTEAAIRRDSEELKAHQELVTFNHANDRSLIYYLTGELFLKAEDYDAAFSQYVYGLEQCVITGSASQARTLLERIFKLRGTQTLQGVITFERMHDVSLRDLLNELEKRDIEHQLIEYLTKVREAYRDIMGS